MNLPSPDTPLYNHPLQKIEEWLQENGCQQNPEKLHCWWVEKPNWQAELLLDIDQLTIRYVNAGVDGSDIQRSFTYSLSRRDIEEAIFSGP